MTPEAESVEGGSKKRKRNVINDNESIIEPEVNKSTDSEADKEYDCEVSASKMSRPVPDRRSSLEAESRLDPGVDTEPGLGLSPVHRLGAHQPQAVKKRARESSLMVSIAMNGDSSSDESDDNSSRGSDTEQIRKIKKVNNSVAGIKEGKKIEKLSNISKPKPVMPGSVSGDEFPRVGDLVWGRMSGFPFWPSFVTRSPQGVFKRDLPSGKKSYHVQFFNWNDESGWVNAVQEFDGLDSFKKIAAKKKTDKSYNPTKGGMYNKWEKAAREAEETLGLTRQERLDQYLVTYGSQAVKSVASPKPAVKPTPKSIKKAVSSPLSAKPVVSVTPKRPKEKEKVKDRDKEEESSLPAGWKIRNRFEIGTKEKTSQIFISPEGKEFKDKVSALRAVKAEVSSLRAVKAEVSSPVRYMKDDSLPAGWRCQKIETSVYYFSPKGERFLNREMVAKRLQEEGESKEVIEKVKRVREKVRVGPKSMMLKWRAEGAIDIDRVSDGDDESESSSEEEESEEDIVNIFRLPNGMKFRKGSKMDEFLDLDKLFDSSNGGIIEMVQLPDIFLEHPTVSVTESDNEMVISDVDTGEFIAKKIIYD